MNEFRWLFGLFDIMNKTYFLILLWILKKNACQNAAARPL